MNPQPFLKLLRKYNGLIYNATTKELAKATEKAGKNQKEVLETLNIAEALYQKEKASPRARP